MRTKLTGFYSLKTLIKDVHEATGIELNMSIVLQAISAKALPLYIELPERYRYRGLSKALFPENAGYELHWGTPEEHFLSFKNDQKPPLNGFYKIIDDDFLTHIRDLITRSSSPNPATQEDALRCLPHDIEQENEQYTLSFVCTDSQGEPIDPRGVMQKLFIQGDELFCTLDELSIEEPESVRRLQAQTHKQAKQIEKLEKMLTELKKSPNEGAKTTFALWVGALIDTIARETKKPDLIEQPSNLIKMIMFHLCQAPETAELVENKTLTEGMLNKYYAQYRSTK